MKKNLLLISLLALLIVGCKNNKKDISELKELSDLKEISEYKSATSSDSMMFYFGQIQASNYWQDAEGDTILTTPEAKEEFMKGFREALKISSDNDAYNKGLQLGLRLGLRLKEFGGRYDQEFSGDVLAASMQYFLNHPDSVDVSNAQKEYYLLKDRLEAKAAHKDVDSAKGNLATEGLAKGYTMLSDTLYYKEVTPGINGARFKEGDKVAVEVTASSLDGKEIVTRQFPESITLGGGRVPSVVNVAIYTMTDGGTRQFMTTPRSLFGKRYANYNLPASEPVIFTVKASYPDPNATADSEEGEEFTAGQN